MIASSVFQAHAAPDAGSLQQQIDRERQQQLPKRLAPEKSAAPAAMKPTSGVTVTVSEFRFAGNTLLSAEQLAPAVSGYLNRPLDFAQLQAATAAVAEAYRAAGWIVRAYLPQQDIQGGIVTIQIVEAVFGKVIHEGPEPTRLTLSTALTLIGAGQKSGAFLNAEALDRALLLADDLPGITVAGSLTAGATDGETDVILKIADEPLIVGEVAADNAGSRSTGEDRLTATLNLVSPLNIGDLLSANAIHTQGSDYVRLSYTLPVGHDGWRVGLNGSDLRYRLITLDPSRDNGRSEVFGLEASYPVVRSRPANLFLNVNADRKFFDNRFGGATSTRYKIDSATAALNGNLFDSLGGGGANSVSVAWAAGERRNEVGTTRQNFSKLRYSLSRQQVITNDFSVFAQLSGQSAGKDLDTSERFYLGGANGVRAYTTSEGGGSRGTMTNVELRWKALPDLTLTAFQDYGHVGNITGMSYSLKGHGLAMGWQTSVGVNLKVTWARREGNNPNPAPNGGDQDGTLVRNRYWLSATLPF